MRALPKIQFLFLPIIAIISLCGEFKARAVDVRIAYPFIPMIAPSRDDGAFVESANMFRDGAAVRFGFVENHNPYGTDTGQLGGQDHIDRLSLTVDIMATIREAADIRLSLPMTFFGSPPGSGFNFGLGDGRVGAKISIWGILKNIPATKKIAEKFPVQIAIAGDVSIALSSNPSLLFNAGPQWTTGGDIKLILESPWFGKFVSIAGNIGGFFGGDSVNPEGYGLGTHFIWGLGVNFKIGDFLRLYAEGVGSVSSTTQNPLSTPVMLVGGLQLRFEKWMISAFYSFGGWVGTAPQHSVFAGVTFFYEKPEKKDQVWVPTVIKGKDGKETFAFEKKDAPPDPDRPKFLQATPGSVVPPPPPPGSKKPDAAKPKDGVVDSTSPKKDDKPAAADEGAKKAAAPENKCKGDPIYCEDKNT